MLKFQIALIAILIGCVTFVSCERTQKMLEPAMPGVEMPGATMDADEMMDMMMDMTMHTSWMSVALPAPPATVTAPPESGGAHGMGTRTVYINETGVMANMEGTAYPTGTMIVKEIMDDANTFVQKVAKMMKTDDPMYADHGGWMYVKYARPSADGEYAMVGGGSLAGSTGCHECHAKAANDSVFVSLSTGDAGAAGMDAGAAGMDADGMDAMAADDMDAVAADEAPDGAAGEPPVDGADEGAAEPPVDGADEGAAEPPVDGADEGAGQ